VTWPESVSSPVLNYADLGRTPWSVVRQIEVHGCPIDASKIIIPESRLSSGTGRRLSHRTIDPADGGVPIPLPPQTARVIFGLY
jgi:hypothetical protein